VNWAFLKRRENTFEKSIRGKKVLGAKNEETHTYD
jgi:hypothetical protein